MPPRQRKWEAPCHDKSLDLNSATQQDPRDPRVLGQGPCENRHEKALPTDLEVEIPFLHWGSNQYGRWADCRTCALRLLYFPRRGYVGKYRSNESAAVVQAALRKLKNRGQFPTCTHKVMKACIALAEAEITIGAKGTTSTTRQGTPKGERPAAAERAPSVRRVVRTQQRSSSAAAATPTPGPEQISVPAETDEDEVMDIKALRAEMWDLRRRNQELEKKNKENTAATGGPAPAT